VFRTIHASVLEIITCLDYYYYYYYYYYYCTIFLLLLLLLLFLLLYYSPGKMALRPNLSNFVSTPFCRAR